MKRWTQDKVDALVAERTTTTLAELGTRHGVSSQRIRQLLQNEARRLRSTGLSWDEAQRRCGFLAALTTDKPDFEALRAARNAKMDAEIARWIADGWAAVPCTLRKRDACYCGCNTGGPCEHDWSGPMWTSTDGRACSVTCARCGITAMSHSWRTGR